MLGFTTNRKLKKEITDNIPIHPSKFKNRTVDFSVKHKTPNVICTTYFTSKQDPQHHFTQSNNSIEYIKPWYDSMIKQGLFGLVFYDNLSDEFVRKYTHTNVKFVKCSLGEYSLNDERFILYYMYFSKVKYDKIFLTDGNDVTVNSATLFEELKFKNSRLFIGRGKENLIFQSPWNRNKISELQQELKTEIPSTLYYMPILNAGVIGGDYLSILYFLKNCSSYFFQLNNTLNNNMAVMHLVVFYSYYYSSFTAIQQFLLRHQFWFFQLFKSKYLTSLFYPFHIEDRKIISRKISHIQLKNLEAGYPIVSLFTHLETDTDACFIHK